MVKTFLSAATPQEAVSLKCSTAAYLAGGTEVNRLKSAIDADTVISIRNLKELKGIKTCEEGISIGAACTFQELLENDQVPAYFKEALHFMGSRQKRNMATIGGNIACLRDDSYLLATLMAADAHLTLMNGDGEIGRMPVGEYIKKSRNDDALILEIILPDHVGDFIATKRYANTVESLSILVVSMAICRGNIRAAAAIKTAGLFELPTLTEALKDPDVTEAQLISLVNELELPISDDFRGSAAYKRYLIAVTLKRMQEDAVKGGVRL